jgi:hypothetical protein
MKKAALYELWTALAAVFHKYDMHPRFARIYVYNNKMSVATRRF